MKRLFALLLCLQLLMLPAGAQIFPEPEPSPSASPSPSPSPFESLDPEPPAEKNPWVAAGFSLLLPGSGQMYVEERIWPEALITAGIALAVLAFVVVDQQRAGSIRERTVTDASGQIVSRRTADAHWDALTLLFQIAVPSLWLWNAGDAYRRAEKFEENVIRDLERDTNAYIIEENLVSVTLWQF